MNALKKAAAAAVVLALVLALTLTGSQSQAQGGNVIYVNHDAAGAGDGASWADAYTDLQLALAAAEDGDQIWVVAGTYYPAVHEAVYESVYAPEVDRSATFRLKDGVSLYGGFAGGETSLAQRDWENNVTVLSGDLERNDITDADGVVTDPDDIVGDNAYSVVTAADIGENTILDGFVITAGKSDVVDHDIMGSDSGGGIYNLQSSPTLSNLIITGCYAPEDSPTWKTGGGMMNDWNSHPTLTNVTLKSNHGRAMVNRYSNPTLTDVVFEDNIMGGMRNYYSSPTLTDVHFISNGDFWAETPGYGGGMHNGNESSPLLTNVTFRGNYVRWHGGGMFNSQNSNPTLINVLFSGNASERTGGGMMNSAASSPTLINVTFSGNYAWYQGGAMSNFGRSHPSLTNSIIWHNYAQTFFATSEIYNEGDQYGEQNICYPEFSHSIIKGSGGSSNWNTYFGIDGGNNIDADPRFVNQPQFSNTGHTGGDLRLQEGSPAIDAGTNSPFVAGGDAYGVTTDLDGNPRIENDVVDMGAYEYQVSVAVVSTAAELSSALQNPATATIRFSSDITADISADRLVDLDFSTYTLNGDVQFDTSDPGALVFEGSAEPAINGNLTVDAPNAAVTNNVKVGGEVIIKDVAGSTWIENADGNDLVIDVQSGTTTVIINGDVNTLTVNGSGDELDIVINGSVQTAVFNAPADVTGAGNITSVHIASEVAVELDEEPQQHIYRLSLLVNPEGGGTAEGGGLYAQDAEISITAQAEDGYLFVNWASPGGVLADANKAGTTFTMPAENVTATANFETSPTATPAPARSAPSRATAVVTAEHALTMGVEGEGTVSPDIREHTYKKGTVVDLEAVPAEDWVFMGWEGPVADAESPTTTVTMDEDAEVTAVFIEEMAEEPELLLLVGEEIEIVLSIGEKRALVNDAERFMDAAPFIKPDANRTLAPVRFISEKIGASVHWLPETRQVRILHGETKVLLTIGSDIALVNGEEVAMDCPPEIVSSRTFLPVRFVSEMLGAAVDWNGKTQTITITKIR